MRITHIDHYNIRLKPSDLKAISDFYVNGSKGDCISKDKDGLIQTGKFNPSSCNKRRRIGKAHKTMNYFQSLRLIFIFLTATMTTGLSLAQIAGASSRYTATPESQDGIGKRYMGREISSVMGWQGAPWLERQEREREERTDLLLTALALKPGMVVADIGAGTGYLTRRMAPAVLPGGKVIAVDVQPEMVRILENSIKNAGQTHIEARLSAVDDVKLPTSSVDIAVMVDVYHELAFPFEVLTSVIKALKPGGRMVFVEYKAEDPKVPIKPLHKMSEAQIRKEAGVFALDWERTVHTLPWQHVVIFRKGN